MSNFQLAHQYYSQSLITLANPISESFVNVRKSSVTNCQSIRQSGKENQLENLKKNLNTLESIKTMLNLIKESHDPLVNCRNSIENLLNKSNNQVLEPNASGIFQRSDDSEEDSNSEKWDDEEIVVG